MRVLAFKNAHNEKSNNSVPIPSEFSCKRKLYKSFLQVLLQDFFYILPKIFIFNRVRYIHNNTTHVNDSNVLFKLIVKIADTFNFI